MSKFKPGNNATSRLATGVNSTATTLSVMTGEGSKFPVLAAGEWFPVTIFNSSGVLEIVKVTARTADALTVTRSQEGTAASAFSAGDRIELRATAAVWDDVKATANKGVADAATAQRAADDAQEAADDAQAAADQSVKQSSGTGAAFFPEGENDERPDEQDIPDGVAATRGNTESSTDYHLELWDRHAQAWTPLASRQWASKSTMMAGQSKGLKCSTTGTNAMVSIVAGQLFVENSSGEVVNLKNVSVSINTKTTGANGIDTGTVAANTWYSAYVISGTAGVAAIACLASATPVLPTGYTQKTKVWSFLTDGTANRFPYSAKKEGQRTQYRLATGSNLTSMLAYASGVNTFANPVSVDSVVPAEAISICGFAYNGLSSSVAYVSPFAFINSGVSAPLFGAISVPSVGSYGLYFYDFLLDTRYVHFASGDAAGRLFCLGWEDNL